MYTLVLTKAERNAIDWIGDRYLHGDNLFHVLEWFATRSGEHGWDSDKDIQFKISEHLAWEIRDIGFEDDFRWTCFSPEFADKMNEFCEKLI